MKYLICNLKAHKNYNEILAYKNYLNNESNIKLIFAPSSLYLNLFKDDNIFLCCQNIPYYEDLNLTGDITFNQLKDLNVKYIMVGHYERRKYYQENISTIIHKIKNSLKNNFQVIYCIGETKEELDRKVAYQVIEKALAQVLNHISPSDFKNIIIAYEPTYLIGTNTNYDFNHLKNMLEFIKNLVKNYYDTDIDVVFGGNITLDNITNFLNIPSLDGFIIGNASLNPSNIPLILEKMTQPKK